jgi:hypothetical protein
MHEHELFNHSINAAIRRTKTGPVRRVDFNAVFDKEDVKVRVDAQPPSSGATTVTITLIF